MSPVTAVPTHPSVLGDLATFGPHGSAPTTYPQAAAYTRRLTEQHYENFTVVSRLLPARLRDDFRHVYAFCRAADDLGDEAGDRDRAVELLTWWRDELEACYAGEPRHPIFVALRRTIETHDLPRAPFDHLIHAFIQDQRVTRYDTYAQVLDYCTRSADPVGRLVLMMYGYRDAERFGHADATCTALQLTNFWQDVRRDVLERDRVYVPRDIASDHGLDVDAMAEAIRRHEACGGADAGALDAVRPAFVATQRDIVARTWRLFDRGHVLWPTIADGRLRACVKLFSRGGEAVLTRIEKQGFDTLERRPKLGKLERARLLLAAGAGRLVGL